jgi:hypothetical protein
MSTSSDLKKYFCPRLIDFVIIVGCKEPATPSQLLAKYQEQFKSVKTRLLTNSGNSASNGISLTQKPELLRRYPFEDHADFMLPQDVIYFCQPEGCSNINVSSQERANSNKDTTSFIFTLTEKDSARVRYGVCINFFRPIEKHQQKKQRKTAAGSTPSSASSPNGKQLNNENADDDDSTTEDTSAASSAQSPSHNETTNTQPKKKRNKKASDVKYTHTLTSLCIISHHPFFSLFRECLNVLRKIIESCHARALASSSSRKTTTAGIPSSTSTKNPLIDDLASSNNNNIQKLVHDTVWGILTGSSDHMSIEQISSLVSCEIREIETWILRLLSAHVPLPGKTKLIVSFILRFFDIFRVF